MEIYILEVFEIDFFNNISKQKKVSKLAYIFLSYIYYIKFGKVLLLKNIIKDKNGKPYLKNKEFYFNISHCKNYICIGISNFEIGVDIEEDREINKNSIKRFLSEDEIQNQEKSILEYWVIKEAYSKFLGLGLKMDFRKIDKKLFEKEALYLYKVNSNHFICYAISKVAFNKLYLIDKQNIKLYLNKNKNIYI